MAAEASFNTEIDSISVGFIPPSRSGTPSITTKGSLLPREFVPRIRIVVPPPPGSSAVWKPMTPGIRPTIPLVKLVVGDAFNSSPVTLATEPVTVTFFCVP